MPVEPQVLPYAVPPNPAIVRARRMRMLRRFYGHFAAAYGTCWLVMLGLAVLTRSHINAGAFGLFGFVIIAALYGFVRLSTDTKSSKTE